MMQQNTPDRSRGRVFSALSTFGSFAGMISMAGAGAAAELVGIPTVYLVSGAVAMLAGLVFGLLVKEPQPAQSPMPSAADPA